MKLVKGIKKLLAMMLIAVMVLTLVPSMSVDVKAATTYTIHFDGTNWNATEMAAAVGAVKDDVIKIVNEYSTDAKYKTSPSGYASAMGIPVPAEWNMGYTKGTLNNNTLEFTVPAGFFLQKCAETDAGGLFLDMQINPTYKVTFNANGGTGSHEPDTDAYGTYTLPTSTTFAPPAGKLFDGWAETAWGTVVTTITVTSNKTVYAKWKNAPTVNVTGVSLSDSTATLAVGENKTLTATVEPSDATNKNVTWSSSDTTVATVDTTGKVTAIKAGTTTITVTTADGDYTADCDVTVTAAPTPAPTSTPCKPEKKADEKVENKEEKKVEKKENPSFTHPDRDKLKSVLPSKSVIASSGDLYDDLKVFSVDDRTKVNQTLLVNNFAKIAGKKARIILTDSLHTSRMLGADNGKTRTLKWANLEKTPQVVYACCYNQTDKAYFIQGILDANGTATFNNFVLRDATNITIFVLE